MKASRAEISTHSRVLRAYFERLTVVFLPVWAVFGLLPNTVIAQDSESSIAQDSESAVIEEIIVTAQRREQNLQDVPISISAFTSAAIEKNMFTDVSEYLTKTPNASFISNGARSRRQISIRGVTNFLTFVGSSTTGFYVDGFSVAGSTINPPIMDIERIEVLRGPQATYFGRNALGGGISITTKKPTNDFGGSFSVDYSSFDTVDAQGIVNIPVNDKLAVRLNYKKVTSDGNIHNINPIGGGNGSNYKYARSAVRYTPSDHLTVDFTFEYISEAVGMREGVPSGVFSTFGKLLFGGEFPDRNGDGNTDPFVDGVGFYPKNRTRTNFNFPQKIGTRFRNGVLRLDYEYGNLLFTSITGYINSGLTLMGDIDGSSRDFFREFRDLERQSVSTEFRIQNTDDGAWKWNLGGIYARDKGYDFNRTFIAEEMSFGLPNGFLIDTEDSSNKPRSWAVFGQVDYDITDQLTLSAGGRFSHETIKSNISGFSGALAQVLSVQSTFTDFSPKFSLSFRANDALTYYATASKGFKSGGVQLAPNPKNESFSPETLWNYEAGVKADLFNRHLRLNLAYFYMNWTDLQVAFQENVLDENGDFILFGGVDNADSATSQGVELSTTAALGDHLLVNFNVGYLDANFDKFTALIDGKNRVLDGKVIPNAPKWTMSSDAEYAWKLNNTLGAFVRLEWTYRDDIKPTVTSLINSGFPWDVPSYNFFNLRFGVKSDKVRIVAYVNNLFDKNYYTNAFQKAFAGGLFIEPSFRRVGVKVSYAFGQ